MHIWDVAVHWGLQKTSSAMAEDGGPKKPDNSPSQGLTASIWANEESKLD